MKIILICGPSCSGKSTVAQILQGILNAPILSVDLFYKLGGEKIYVEKNGERYRTFERKELYDGERVAQLLEELQEKDEVHYLALNHVAGKKLLSQTIHYAETIIVEGFHALNYPQLRKLASTKIYLDLPFEEQKKRRQARGGREASDTSFQIIGKDEYEKYVLPQKEEADIILDARKTTKELVDEILQRL